MRQPAAILPSTDLGSIFTPACVEYFPDGTTKPRALRRLVDSLVRDRRIPADKADSISDALIERERLGTTGMGKGLALPHMRSRNVEVFAGAIGVAPEGIDFNSLDGTPTRLVILLISPFEQRQQHSYLMAKLAMLMSDRTLQYSLQVERTPASLLTFLGFASPADRG
jgi:mannitol/fructose-specific phosphotransferase system IIA component (Ntr-type)